MNVALASVAAALTSVRHRSVGLLLGLLVVLGVVLPSVWSRKAERRTAAYRTIALLISDGSITYDNASGPATENGLPDAGVAIPS